jgi:hypothetical protein
MKKIDANKTKRFATLKQKKLRREQRGKARKAREDAERVKEELRRKEAAAAEAEEEGFVVPPMLALR